MIFDSKGITKHIYPLDSLVSSVSTATTHLLHPSSQTSPTSLSFEAMADEMDVDQPKTKGKKEAKDSSKARFEVKKVM
jgi:hypothetical protein